MFDKKEISKRLKIAREALPGKVNPRQFSLEADNVDDSQYAKFEKGGPLGQRKIMELCTVWNINPQWLYTGVGEMFIDGTGPKEEIKQPGSDNHQADEPSPSLKDVMISLGSISSDLGTVLNEQAIARAEVRAFGQYQVSRDTKGDKDQIAVIMEQIGKLIGANLKASAKRGKKTG